MGIPELQMRKSLRTILSVWRRKLFLFLCYMIRKSRCTMSSWNERKFCLQTKWTILIIISLSYCPDLVWAKFEDLLLLADISRLLFIFYNWRKSFSLNSGIFYLCQRACFVLDAVNQCSQKWWSCSLLTPVIAMAWLLFYIYFTNYHNHENDNCSNRFFPNCHKCNEFCGWYGG